MNTRVGVGYDLHRLETGRALRLGGIEVPYERGLAGHSDGDVVLHAIADALLGAAGLEDIGTRYPPGDARYAGIASSELLGGVVADLTKRGWRVVNVDVTIVAEAPKMAPYRSAMREAIGALLGVEGDAIGLKAKTNEGLGAIGRGEAIAVLAVALIDRGET